MDRDAKVNRLAGDHAETMLAHHEAHGYYRTALRLANEPADERVAAHVHAQMGTVLRASGHYVEAIEELDRAVELYQALDDVDAVARITATIVDVQSASRQTEAGLLRVQPVIAIPRWSRLSKSSPRGYSGERAGLPNRC